MKIEVKPNLEQTRLKNFIFWSPGRLITLHPGHKIDQYRMTNHILSDDSITKISINDSIQILNNKIHNTYLHGNNNKNHRKENNINTINWRLTNFITLW